MSSGSYSSQVSQNEQNTYTTTNTSTDLAGATIGLTGANFVQVASGVESALQYSQATNAALAAVASGSQQQQSSSMELVVVAVVAAAAIAAIFFFGIKGK